MISENSGANRMSGFRICTIIIRTSGLPPTIWKGSVISLPTIQPGIWSLTTSPWSPWCWIYADFRVKQMRGEDGRELTKIYTLKDSFDVILSKLDNVDEKKRNRYRVVYSRLYEFERYMRSKGVDVDLTGHPDPAEKPVDIVLQSGKQVVRSFVFWGSSTTSTSCTGSAPSASSETFSRRRGRERLEECPRIFKHVQ